MALEAVSEQQYADRGQGGVPSRTCPRAALPSWFEYPVGLQTCHGPSPCRQTEVRAARSQMDSHWGATSSVICHHFLSVKSRFLGWKALLALKWLPPLCSPII
ncbi:hypothetical protein EYF80_015906 [Liparis tanakae]|uniref:Uncharacterized protein n=1 Tax=Liparis tanakae TaxID=230148 RepID=A0A4Z2I755_9TELE|nr:hypothetical protein EYF80_015906 [Liparis tanakae]